MRQRMQRRCCTRGRSRPAHPRQLPGYACGTFLPDASSAYSAVHRCSYAATATADRSIAPRVAPRQRADSRKATLAGATRTACPGACIMPREPSAGHVHVDTGGDLDRAGGGAIGDASEFPIEGLGCCTGCPFIDARRRSSACAVVTRPAMQQDRHHHQHVHAGKFHRRRPRVDYLANLALPLVPHALRGTRSAGLPAPQPAGAQGQGAGEAQPWP